MNASASEEDFLVGTICLASDWSGADIARPGLIDREASQRRAAAAKNRSGSGNNGRSVRERSRPAVHSPAVGVGNQGDGVAYGTRSKRGNAPKLNRRLIVVGEFLKKTLRKLAL